MALLLGIDTGGTYTDAVLYRENGGVIASAKALTTPGQLERGIENALSALPSRTLTEVDLVSLSTTLATNAVVEGRGGRVCLLLLGYPDDALGRAGLGEALGEDPAIFIRGGHDVTGAEQEPLDEEAVEAAARDWGGRVAAFAVSGYFGVKNPGHENRARRVIRDLTGLPVTCGHELTAQLHASRRALTAAFNARLVPLLGDLIRAVGGHLEKRGITAPLMVVKGDGSLMGADFALEHPIETILSGPAASVVGATFLSGLRDGVVSDMGGTTTDVAVLRDGRPVLNTQGAVVGGRHLFVEAARIFTFGLGGDSEVRLDEGGRVRLGPGRVVPLCLLGADHPHVLPVLEAQAGGEEFSGDEGRFVLGRPAPGALREGELTTTQREILRAVREAPRPLTDLVEAAESPYLLRRDLARLAAAGAVILAGFTPSDAAHVLGYQNGWNREAAEAAARLFLRRGGLREDIRELCRRVYLEVCAASASAVLETSLAEGNGIEVGRRRDLFSFFASAAFGGGFANGDGDAGPPSVKVSFALARKIVGIGAPAATYYPRVGGMLSTETVIPRHAEVAGAVGAVAGNVFQKVEVLIEPLADAGGYRVHGPEGARDFPELEEAVRHGEARARAEAESLARRAGAENPDVRASRRDLTGRALDGEILLEVRVTAAASGRPRMGRPA